MNVFIHSMARLSSTRTPGKSAAELAGAPAFVRSIERIQEFLPDVPVIVNTTMNLIDDSIAMLARNYGYEIVRYVEESPSWGLSRVERFIRDHALASDDILIWDSGGDTPLAYATLLPFLIEQMQQLKCDRFTWAENPAKMLIGGVCWPHIVTVGAFLKSYESFVTFEEFPWWSALDGNEKRLLVPIPRRLKQPWPWRIITLDYPVQVTQTKLIYKELYRGRPIDIFEVYELLKAAPALAHLTDACPGHTKYGQHLDWFWNALRAQPHELVEIPDNLVI